MVERRIKKSDFVAQTTMETGDRIDFTRNGQNYAISFENFLTAISATGVLSPKGEVTAIPVLDVDGALNYIRGILVGVGLGAEISAGGAVKLSHKLVAGTGITLTESGDNLVISLT